ETRSRAAQERTHLRVARGVEQRSEFARERRAREVSLQKLRRDALACDEVDEAVVLDLDEATERVPVERRLLVDDDERRTRERGGVGQGWQNALELFASAAGQ